MKVTKSLKLGKETGSVMNWIMSNNNTKPEVGKGATVLNWTDRTAYEVIEVSEDLKTVKIQRYDAKRIDSNGMSESQKYEYKELCEGVSTIVFKNGVWKQVTSDIILMPEYQIQYENKIKEIGYNEAWEEMIKPLVNEYSNLTLVDGKTKLKKKYTKISILWGVLDQYYDYSF